MQSQINSRKSQLAMVEKDAFVTETNNKKCVHSANYRTLNNTHREKLQEQFNERICKNRTLAAFDRSF